MSDFQQHDALSQGAPAPAASPAPVSVAVPIPAPAPAASAINASRSPYVLSQRTSEIRWHLFNDEAIDRAKTENKLIYLHIGYSASHYCYLTSQESFSNHHVVQLLNDHFIPVIVDREERPDLDSIYMTYVNSLNSVSGHPLNVFLTPKLEPVYGGAYFPGPGAHLPAHETGEDIIDFLVILQTLQSKWALEQDRLREDGEQSVETLRKLTGEGTLGGTTSDGEIDLDQLEEAYDHISKSYDDTYGGFIHPPPNAARTFSSGNVDLTKMKETYDYIKQRPKFISPAKLSFLIKATLFPQVVTDVVGEGLSSTCSTISILTLGHILAGGIHDHVGGGFHRCSVTRDWSLPTFEKMLSDNSLALGLYLDAWLLLGKPVDGNHAPIDGQFADTVFELADYLTTSPVVSEIGGFTTSIAADSFNKRGDTVLRHGAYYLWTRKEFDTVIGEEQEIAVAAAYWDVKEHGNVDKDQDPNDEYLNQNILQVARSTADLGLQFHISEADVIKLVESSRAKLRAHREKERPLPAIDSKIVTAYNGMAIGALARTAAACIAINESERGTKYLKAAIDAANFIRNELYDVASGTLYRMYGEGGRADTEAFAEDHAFLVEGLLELYEASADESWLRWADDVQSIQIRKFYDDPSSPEGASNARCGAFYSTTQDAPHILLRIKDAMDTSQPSTNAVSASNLFRLSALLDDEKYSNLARETVNAFEAEMLQYPHLFPGLLSSVVSWKLGGRRWVSIGDNRDSSLLKGYYLEPRAGLRTILHANPDSDFLGSRSPDLIRKIQKSKPGVHDIVDGELLAI